jgi:hypothetical protein
LVAVAVAVAVAAGDHSRNQGCRRNASFL